MVPTRANHLGYCWALAFGFLFFFATENTHGQAGLLWKVCRMQADGTRFPGYDCNQYIECRGGTATPATCISGQNYNPDAKTCQSGYSCSGPRGLWRQVMESSGLVAIHCTLVPGTGMVVIWHRGLRNINDIPWDMKQPDGNGHEYMSAVIDPLNNKRQGYKVAPSFCGGHVQLPDSSIMNCGGEPAGFNGRGSADSETGISGCRIFKCKGQTVDSCSWRTLGQMSANRWYPGMLLFPAYEPAKGPFAMVMGGSTLGWDPYQEADVMQTVDWIFPFATDRKTFINSPATSFTKKMKERNMYPAVYLMPFRRGGKFVLFQWAVNYGELAIVNNPANTSQPVVTHRPLPSLPRPMATTYPTGGCVALHALEYPWDKSAQVSMFGGHNARPNQGNLFQSFPDLSKIDASWLASSSAFTLNLTAYNQGADITWEEEAMPGPATMRTCITLPNGKILLFHGVKNGRMTSTPDGLGCGKNQVYNTWIFDPKKPKGSRFTVDPSNEPTFRAYHSCGLVMPDGSLFGAGGDTAPVPDGVTSCTAPRKLYYNVDSYIPPSNYKATLTATGPYIKSAPAIFNYGKQHKIQYSGPVDECSLVTPAANTHEVEQSGRVVFLRTVSNNITASPKELVVEVPMDPAIIMPGQHMLFCISERDVYSQSVWVTVKYA